MSRLRQLCVALLLQALALPGHPQLLPKDDPIQQDIGKTILSLQVPSWANGLKIPLKVGAKLQMQDLLATEDLIRQQLITTQSGFAVPTNLDVTLVAPRVIHFQQGVILIFKTQRLVLTEDDTPGRAMDESTTWTPTHTDEIGQFGMDFNRDQRLGDALGGMVALGPSLFARGESISTSVSGWTSVTDHYYDLTGQFQVRPGVTRGHGELDCGPEFNFSYVPFAVGTVRNISATVGCGYRFGSTLEQWRLVGRYRFSHQKLDAPAAAERAYQDHGFEAALLHEFSTSHGFVRIEPWMDFTHSDILGWNARLGALVRGYREWKVGDNSSFMTLDVLAGAGETAGPLPANRSFIGGAQVHSTNLEEPLDTEDFVWMGPLLRGYGVASYYPPSATSLLTRGGTSYSNLSVTVGLPGLSEPLFSSHGDPELEFQVSQLSDTLTAATRTKALTKYLEEGYDPGQARIYAQKRLAEMRRTLKNVIENTKEISVRPVVAFDYGQISSRDGTPVHDWSVGGGLREWLRGGLVEVLYMHNGQALPGIRASNFIVRYTVHNPIGGTRELPTMR